MKWITQFTIVLVFNFFFAETSRAQMGYTLCSLEWLAADADTVARGIVTDVLDEPASEGFTCTVITLDVREVLKGRPAGTLRFVVRRAREDTSIDRWRDRRTELLWFLNRGEPRADSADLVASLERRDTDLYA